MNHAVFCVTPMARWTSYELMPFLALASSHSVGSHLSKPSGESSKIVPTFIENCLRDARHFQIRRERRKEGFSALQCGQRTPLGQRSCTMNASALSGSAK